MDKELQLLLPLMSEAWTEEIDGCTYHLGIIEGHKVVISKCGIGKVNAALSTQSMIAAYSPSLVINTGVAGGTGSEADILDIVVGTRVVYHDTWCGPGTTWGQADACPEAFTPPPSVLECEPLRPTQGVHHGLICSGDIFVDSPEVVEAIRSNFPEALAVDMESAAICHACYRAGVPCVCVRVLSDTPGSCDDNASQYLDFWAEAPERTFAIVRTLIRHLPV